MYYHAFFQVLRSNLLKIAMCFVLTANNGDILNFYFIFLVFYRGNWSKAGIPWASKAIYPKTVGIWAEKKIEGGMSSKKNPKKLAHVQWRAYLEI